jgi:pimeloyl-ACP methyl ester carboxylesterase
MPAFAAADGTELAYHVRGAGAPLVCVPGGPMRASAYLGDLGGLSAHRQLIMLDLRGTGIGGCTDPVMTGGRSLPSRCGRGCGRASPGRH